MHKSTFAQAENLGFQPGDICEPFAGHTESFDSPFLYRILVLILIF